MMIENVKKFKQALREDRELADHFAEEVKRITDEKSAGSDAEAIVRAANTLGFDFTIADVEKVQAETQEIDPEERIFRGSDFQAAAGSLNPKRKKHQNESGQVCLPLKYLPVFTLRSCSLFFYPILSGSR